MSKDTYGSEGEFVRGRLMANGIEQDVRDIRKEILTIQRDGCGHKHTHETNIEKLWEAIESIKEGQGILLRNVVLSVFGVVLSLMVANFFVTRQTVQAMAENTQSTTANIASENRAMLKALTEEIKNIKDVESVQSDMLRKHRERSTYDPGRR
jgi:hypothetical protein